ncbi:MAG TPA: hypothetical protein ENN77_01445 [Candidatus Wirthbacteria bacterium]|nr:hypothetical protein [Candidatus Wirthbacteria bacterium]
MTFSLLSDGTPTGMRLKIGVMGSASGELLDHHLKNAYLLGKAIADNGCICVTGACPGLPYETAKGVKENGGLVVGISPGLSLDEHLYKYHSPIDYCDVLIFTGSGLMGREISNIRSCDIVIIIGGRSGTLGEFSIAYDEGKLIGVLTKTGGIADFITEIEKVIRKNTGSKIVYHHDPIKLIENLLKTYQDRSDQKHSTSHKNCQGG